MMHAVQKYHGSYIGDSHMTLSDIRYIVQDREVYKVNEPKYFR